MIDRLQNKLRVRGYILKALDLCYCKSALIDSLHSLVISTQLIESVDIMSNIGYLEDRKYVEIIEKPTDLGFKLKYVKLTSKGTDVLDGLIKDPGVIVDGRS